MPRKRKEEKERPTDTERETRPKRELDQRFKDRPIVGKRGRPTAGPRESP